MLLAWWRRRRLKRKSDRNGCRRVWIARHGQFALPLARLRAIDAYLLGDLREQEHWSRIREMIEDEQED